MLQDHPRDGSVWPLEVYREVSSTEHYTACMTTLEDTRILPTAMPISVRLARRRGRHSMEPAQAATSVPIEVIDRSRSKEKAFYLLLPVDLVETNERTSRRTMNWPWESSHASRRTSCRLWPTR